MIALLPLAADVTQQSERAISTTGIVVIIVNLLAILGTFVVFGRWLRNRATVALRRIVTAPVEELTRSVDDLKKSVETANEAAQRANKRIDAMLMHQAFPASEMKGGVTNG